MNRPLLISDCDEVLLHMVSHFSDWIAEAHDLDLPLTEDRFDFTVRDRKSGEPVAQDRIWPLLDSFFDTEMHRQNIVPGAAEALAEVAKHADIVILTNLGDEYRANRVEQLEAFDIRHEVLCNRGGKGQPVREVIDRMRPSVAVFVDDLANHHESVASHAPEVWRLHMIAEPRLARHFPPAPEAHVRIDDWSEATNWILERFAAGRPAA